MIEGTPPTFDNVSAYILHVEVDTDLAHLHSFYSF